ncbi:MAG: alpha/beta fold hydrolase [Acidimicrobiales bacterium]
MGEATGAAGRSGTATVRGVELAYELSGAGRSVVWGHGLSASRAYDDEFPQLELERLAGSCRLLRYDARGHGESGFTPDPGGYSWEELARDQLALAEVLGLGRYAAGGASMGCGTALHAAVLAPERVDALLLVIPPTAWETRRERVEIWEQVAGIVETTSTADAFVSAMLAAPTPDPLVGRAEWDARFDFARRENPTRLAGVLRGTGRADLPARERIAEITAPALILAWSGDPTHPVSTAEQLAELLPDAELAVAGNWEELQTWTDRAAAFLQR